MEKKTYERPALHAEKFMVNEYLCACYSVACVQNSYYNYQTYKDDNTIYWEKAAYGSDCHNHNGSCRTASNNYIITDDKTGQITGGYEANAQQGKISIGSNGYYIDQNGNGKCDAGDIVFWSTYSTKNDRCWNHYGTAVAADAKHPNAS